jgi:hypothetical protein
MKVLLWLLLAAGKNGIQAVTVLCVHLFSLRDEYMDGWMDDKVK